MGRGCLGTFVCKKDRLLGLSLDYKKQSPWVNGGPGATVGVNKSEEADSNLCLK